MIQVIKYVDYFMEKIDARRLSLDQLGVLRHRAIRLLKQERTQADVAGILGVRAATISDWNGLYKTGGKKSFKLQQPGPSKGSNSLLTPEQEKEIKRLIVGRTPEQLKLPFVLWDRKAVKELIYRQYSIQVAIRTIGEYLHRWNFTPQRPVKRAYEQQPKEVQRWLDDVYPAIQMKAKQENAEIHWGDETGFHNDHHYGRGYSPRGKTPEVRLSAKRVGINMLSSITNQGKVRFMVYRMSMNAQILIKFLRRLIKGNDRKIILILDNLRVHHAYIMRDWLKGKDDQIEIFYLPSYSPELNPDEYLNNDLKPYSEMQTV